METEASASALVKLSISVLLMLISAVGSIILGSVMIIWRGEWIGSFLILIGGFAALYLLSLISGTHDSEEKTTICPVCCGTGRAEEEEDTSGA